MTLRVLVPAALGLALAAGACAASKANLPGRAADEWTRSYPLTGNGIVEIGNTNGLVEIEAVTGSTVEVRAERIARAASDAAARDLLPRIVIKEDIRPDRVAVQTERMEGIMIGASIEVRYHVRAPRTAIVEVSTTNGRITLSGLGGQVTARTTNGGLAATGLTGSVNARSTNGSVNVEMASVGSDSGDRIELRTTNGAVALKVPESIKADLSASVTNGSISVTGVNLDATEQTRRRVEGRINGGGTPIELSATNGSIRVGTE